MSDAAAVFVVRGRVQGVWFRESVRREAERIGGLVGDVRNLGDGTVLVRVRGAAAAVAELRGFLHIGPPLAQVEAVEESPWTEPTDQAGFRVAR